MHELQGCRHSDRTQRSFWNGSLEGTAMLTPRNHSFTIFDQRWPPESLLGESQCSTLTLMSSIPMNTIQSDTALVRRHHECGHALRLSFKGHIQVQQIFIQDQTISYSKEHAPLAFHVPSQQLMEESVSLWRRYLPTHSEPLFAHSQHGVRVLRLCPVHHVHRSQLCSLKACLLPEPFVLLPYGITCLGFTPARGAHYCSFHQGFHGPMVMLDGEAA